MGETEGRRARGRRETLQQLHAAAVAEIREHGAAGLSLRRVARRMAMSPAGLYRYIDSRDGLLTRLITEAYDDLADHLLVALGAEAERRPGTEPIVGEVAGPGCDVTDRLRAVALAYREWGVAHPQEFALLFGDPIPGYAAPPGGSTVAAISRMGSALGRPIVEAWNQDRLRLPRAAGAVIGDPEAVERFAALLTLDGHELPPEVGVVLLQTWGRLHGQVSLEVFGHHRWVFPDGCEGLYRADLDAFEAHYLVPA